MLKVEVSKKNKIILLILLLVLNLILRIPSIPHEKGTDSFFIHALANSITTFGQAKWWINWLSVFGLYPYSYASALPFCLSGVSQAIGIINTDMEKSILIISMIIGLFSIFVSYTLAGRIYEDFLFKFLVALFYSTSQGVLVFSTWEPSSRGIFIVFFPLFLFCLLSDVKYLKKIPLLLLMGVFIASSHNYFYFLIPSAITYIILILILKLLPKKKVNIYGGNFLNYIYIISLLSAFFVLFYMVKISPQYGSKGSIINVLIVNIRYIGPLIIFAISGTTYLTLKKRKKINEWYFLIIITLLLPFLYNNIYGVFVFFLFPLIFIAIAFRNLLEVSSKSKIGKLLIVVLILISVTFSSYYCHYRTKDTQEINWYMEDSTYVISLWSNEYVPQSSHGFGIGESNRVFPTSDGHPIMAISEPSDLAYGLINGSQMELVKVSPFSSKFYLESPYKLENNKNPEAELNWILEHEIDYRTVELILDKYNYSYFIMPSKSSGLGIESTKSKKNCILDSGEISIWLIKEL